MSGITNPLGTTCFASSINQMIAGCDMFFGEFRRHSTIHSDKSGECMSCIYGNLLQLLNRRGSPLDVELFYPIFEHTGMSIKEQGDPKEYFEAVINTLNPGLRNLISYRLSRCVKCPICEGENRLNDDELYSITVSKDQLNVQDALDYFLLPEQLDVLCQICSAEDLQLEKVINYYPPILVVHNVDGKAKLLNQRITMGTQCYVLLSFSLMKGSSRHRHYTAIRSLNDEVLEFDDANVIKGKYCPTTKRRFYVAFYVREDDKECGQDLRTKIRSPLRTGDANEPEPSTSGVKSSSASEKKNPSQEKESAQSKKDESNEKEKPIKCSDNTKGKEDDPSIKKETIEDDTKGNVKNKVSQKHSDDTKKIDDRSEPSKEKDINPEVQDNKNKPKDDADNDDLDDTINYTLEIDSDGRPIIGTMRIIIKDENDNEHVLSTEEEYLQYLGEKAREIKFTSQQSNQKEQGKPDSYEVDRKILSQFKDGIKDLTVTLVKGVVEKALKKKKEKIGRGRPKGSSKIPKVNTSTQVVSPLKKKKKVGKNKPIYQMSHKKSSGEDPTKKIRKLVKNYKQSQKKVQKKDRKEYTYRQWSKKGLKEGRRHKSFLLQSSNSILPTQQRCSRSTDGINCILCNPTFLARNPEDLISHYERIHYSRVYYISKFVRNPIIMLKCKCKDVITRCTTNRNVHHHCPICWRPMDKLFDIIKHMTSGKKGHDYKKKDIVEK